VILDISNNFWREIQIAIENISRQNFFYSRMTRGKNLLELWISAQVENPK
jgi:hypothetical protein